MSRNKQNIGRPVEPFTTDIESQDAVRELKKREGTIDTTWCGAKERVRQGIGTRFITVEFSESYTPGSAQEVSFYPLVQKPDRIEVKSVEPLADNFTQQPAVWGVNKDSWTYNKIYVVCSHSNVRATILIQ